jgi:hypothetical protein
MSIRLLCSLLVLMPNLIVISVSNAETKTADMKAESGEQSFVIIPLSSCEQAAFKGACKASKLTSDFEGRTLKIQGSAKATAILSTSNGSGDEHAELTCYRCAFGKVPSAADCGRYEKIHKVESWAKKCPELPK